MWRVVISVPTKLTFAQTSTSRMPNLNECGSGFKHLSVGTLTYNVVGRDLSLRRIKVCLLATAAGERRVGIHVSCMCVFEMVV